MYNIDTLKNILNNRRQIMNKNSVKILIGDDSIETGIKIASHLHSEEIFAYTRKNDYNVIFNAIVKDEPDIVICNLVFNETDSLIMIDDLKEMKKKIPVYIVISDTINPFIIRLAKEKGALCCLPQDFSLSDITEAVNKARSVLKTGKESDIEVMVTEVIHKLGVPAHIKGYHYLRSAIINSLLDRSLMECVTKLLYPTIAMQFDTTSSRVERSIRHAIEIAWDRSGTSDFYSYFGYSPSAHRSKPTNSEFIALITDSLRLQLKNQK